MALFKKATFCVITLSCLFLLIILQAQAGEPSGNNWFQLLTTIPTGNNETGDGGTGNPDDFNYYYVGQSWMQNIQINSVGTNASNIWIDYDGDYVTPSAFSSGNYFPIWVQMYATSTGGSNYRLLQTGFRTDGLYSSGTTSTGNFGSFRLTALQPTAANYGTGTFQTLDINIGTVGNTNESNISADGLDLLEDAEDFNFHIWADTIKPYALNPNPASGTSSFNVASNYTFDLRDSKNGEGDDSGVGTGVDIATGSILINSIERKSSANFFCSGIWGTNLCNTTINPSSPSSIPSDTRNWDYNTTYNVSVSGFQDLASGAPNTMDTKNWSFTTEADTIAPEVQSVFPNVSSSGNIPSTNIEVEVVDKKSANVSGVGINSGTCKIKIQSASFAETTFTQGSLGVSVNEINYGYKFTINPTTNFAQSETVFVTVYDCEDLVGNEMVDYNYTFTTADLDTVYVDQLSPADNDIISENQNITFHLKDNGSGVNLSRTVVYVNGVYYTNTGWSGVFTDSGTKITIPTSLTFTSSGTLNDYQITIDPASNFTAGEAIPIIIYSQDLDGNLMERYVYSVSVSGATCPTGSSYCGTNTSWTNGFCIGTGGSTGTSSGGGSLQSLAQINPSTANAVQVNETSVLITWYSSMPGDSRVIYGKNSPQTMGSASNYNYEYSTVTQDDNSTYHSVLVKGLESGSLYYFKPVTKMQGNLILGNELAMAPLFKTAVAECPVCPEVTKCPTCPVCPVLPPTTETVTTPTITDQTKPPVVRPPQLDDEVKKPVKILNIIIDKISADQSVIKINGRSEPATKLILTIY